MQNIYGYIYASVFNETGLTEKGAKIAASRCGYFGNSLTVGYRSPSNNMFIATAKRYNDDKQWFKIVYL